MPTFAQRLIGKAGMAFGIMVIVGSITGGIVLAADLSRTDDHGDTGVPAGNEGIVTPSDTGTQGGAGPTVSGDAAAPSVPVSPPGGTGAGTPTSTPPEPAPPPSPTPTCWTGDGERPDGIEKCEDDDD